MASGGDKAQGVLWELVSAEEEEPSGHLRSGVTMQAVRPRRVVMGAGGQAAVKGSKSRDCGLSALPREKAAQPGRLGALQEPEFSKRRGDNGQEAEMGRRLQT